MGAGSGREESADLGAEGKGGVRTESRRETCILRAAALIWSIASSSPSNSIASSVRMGSCASSIESCPS